ncbi:MAG: AAA domain-containing protein [Kiritimatiellaeota bacterium]|nr:AAA domain-containing protein [Kiritimatiellota bacterium]
MPLFSEPRDRFLARLTAAVREPAADGIGVFDLVAGAAVEHLYCRYVGLALVAPRGHVVTQFRHRGRPLGGTGPETLLRERVRAWRTGAPRRWDRENTASVWSIWPLLRDRDLLGAFAVQWPRTYGPDPQAAPAFRSVLDLAASLIVRSLTIEELRRLHEELLDENEYLREEVKLRFHPENIVWVSGAMEEVVQTARRLAPTTATVLIEGETGTGKELLAHLIHEHSSRASGPFIRVNCAALPESLLESELFGHVRGAFTGATSDRKGRFEAADGGTIFLDEIGDVSRKLQVRLLRVLQEREIERVGDHRPRRLDVRVIAATNRSLEEEVAAGRFRDDLYYRLNVTYLRIPPLRERPEDILPLAEYFLDRYSRENFKQVESISPVVVDLLRAYHWPGNVRELQNCMEKAVILAPGRALIPELLPSAVTAATAQAHRVAAPGKDVAPDAALATLVHEWVTARPGLPRGEVYRRIVTAVERPLLAAALELSRGNQLEASRILGINRNTLRKKLRQHRVDPRGRRR